MDASKAASFCEEATWRRIPQARAAPAVLSVLQRGESRSSYIGGSDARIVLGKDENALIRLWKEKRGEIEPEDLSGNLLVQFGCATEDLNRRWFERETGRTACEQIQRFLRHPRIEWMGATL